MKFNCIVVSITGETKEKPFNYFVAVVTIITFIWAVGAIVANAFFPTTGETKFLVFFVVSLLTLVLVILVTLTIWIHFLVKANEKLNRDYYSSLTAKDVEISKQNDKIEILEKGVNRLKSLSRDIDNINNIALLGCHEVSHELRNYNHSLLEYLGWKVGEESTPPRYKITESSTDDILRDLLTRVKAVFEKKTNSKCTVAFKKCLEYENSFTVIKGVRDKDSETDSIYWELDNLIPRINDQHKLSVDQCYEYAYIFDDSNKDNFCPISDVKPLIEQGVYFHDLFFPERHEITFRSKLVTTVGFKGNEKTATTKDMTKLYGFLEVECKDLGLTIRDHPYLASIADRMYTTFALHELCMTKMKLH